MDVDEIIGATLLREGGYVNNPADRGGATNYGISEAVARAQGYAGDMRALPRDEAISIYRRLYWQRPKLDAVAEIAMDVAAKLFDIGVNMGPATAIGFLKRALNVLNRGGQDYAEITTAPIIDDATLAALRALLAKRGAEGVKVLLKAIDALQGEHYIAIAEARPADKAFVYGWLDNRIG